MPEPPYHPVGRDIYTPTAFRVMCPGLSPGDKTYKVTARMREAANRILKGNSYKLILKEH